MSTISSTGMARYNINDPADLKVLVTNGLIWKGGPKAMKLAVEAVVNGDVPLADCHNMPDNVRSYIEGLLAKVQTPAAPAAVPADPGVPPVAEQPAPVEQPVVDPADPAVADVSPLGDNQAPVTEPSQGA